MNARKSDSLLTTKQSRSSVKVLMGKSTKSSTSLPQRRWHSKSSSQSTMRKHSYRKRFNLLRPCMLFPISYRSSHLSTCFMRSIEVSLCSSAKVAICSSMLSLRKVSANRMFVVTFIRSSLSSNHFSLAISCI